MILNYFSEDKRYEILPSSFGRFPGCNSFTVIVGKNGTGKSRLLQGIVAEIFADEVENRYFDREERSSRFYHDRRSVDFLEQPSKVICVSTSPFDKFPLLKRNAASSRYSYLGLRGLPSQNLSTAYMARIIAALFTGVATAPGKSSSVIEVLRYLGYQGVIECRFAVGIPSRIEDEILSAVDPFKAISELRTAVISGPDGINIVRQLRESDPDEVLRALQILRSFKSGNRKPRLDVVLDEYGIHADGLELDSILPLVRTGVARLRDVTLHKLVRDGLVDAFRLNEASSGEQSVVMSLLGIASQIEDNSLICIDEPEVCLHPEWQERYLHLLLETFSMRRNCQFIIATHSPQIVAELPDANCFVMNMSDGQIVEAKDFSHRSIDFQLANVFKTPGRQNEYLNRTALNLFSRVAQAKSFALQDERELSFLNDLYQRISADDLLRDLIDSLNQMSATYGRN
jgi:predicted ATPase